MKKKGWQHAVDEVNDDEGFEDIDIKRLDKIIQMMENVPDRLFNIDDWVVYKVGNEVFSLCSFGTFSSVTDPERPRTEKSLEKLHNECGMAACVGGHLSLQKFFKDAGGSSRRNGTPVYNGYEGVGAFNVYLGLLKHHSFGHGITMPDCGFYDEVNGKIRPRDVLARLRYARKLAVDLQNKVV